MISADFATGMRLEAIQRKDHNVHAAFTKWCDTVLEPKIKNTASCGGSAVTIDAPEGIPPEVIETNLKSLGYDCRYTAIRGFGPMIPKPSVWVSWK
jgi:hypothetical protein